MKKPSAGLLGGAAFAHVVECRRSLKEGNTNLSDLEHKVRAYCDAVAALPKAEMKEHARHLEALVQEISKLGEELTAARETVKRELEGLGSLRRANIAYQKTDAIGPVYRMKEEDET